MREILFRGKTLDENEWVEGGYSQAIDMDDNIRYHFVLGGEDEAYFGGGEIGNFNKVDGDTVSQYTGLTDKNGKKIFEGDIIKIQLGCELSQFYVVEWNNEYGCYVGKDPISGIEFRQIHSLPYCIQVIGNKWDNPELLEANND